MALRGTEVGVEVCVVSHGNLTGCEPINTRAAFTQGQSQRPLMQHGDGNFLSVGHADKINRLPTSSVIVRIREHIVVSSLSMMSCYCNGVIMPVRSCVQLCRFQ